MYTAARFINSVHCTNVLSGMLPFFIRSAFVHDTPGSSGNIQATISEHRLTGICPLCGFHRAALIACGGRGRSDCDWTGVSLSSSVIIAHCSCHLPFETRHSRSLRRGHGASFHMLTGFHSPKRKYLMNVYPLVKIHERKISPLTYRRFTRRNITPFTKTFLIFF